jgi:hypothetical protein
VVISDVANYDIPENLADMIRRKFPYESKASIDELILEAQANPIRAAVVPTQYTVGITGYTTATNGTVSVNKNLSMQDIQDAYDKIQDTKINYWNKADPTLTGRGPATQEPVKPSPKSAVLQVRKRTIILDGEI